MTTAIVTMLKVIFFAICTEALSVKEAEVEAVNLKLAHYLGLEEVPDWENVDVSEEEWAKMDFVYRMAERQTRIMSELQQDFESDEAYVATNGDSDGVGRTEPSSSRARHVNRNKAYKPQADWSESQRKKRSISSARELQLKFQIDEEAATSLVLVKRATLVVDIRRTERHYSGGATKTVFAAKQVLPLGDDGTGINLDYVVVDSVTTKIEFDVTHAVQHWILEPEENAGLAVECKSGCEEIEMAGESEAQLEVMTASKKMDVRNRFRRSLMYHADFTERERKLEANDCPVEEDGAEEDADELRRHRTRQRIRNHKKNSRARRGTTRRRGLHKRRKSTKRRKCCRAPMKVPLSSETGYAFVVRPDFIEARACRGRCPSGHLPRDAHSDIQNLMRRLEGKHIPRPCCVPARTSSKALLHLDPKRKGKLEVTFWKDIVVEECTCA